MLGRAIERYVRMSPRKVRFVMDPVRGRSVAQALDLLAGMHRRAAKAVRKAVVSAFANARQKDPTLTEETVVISRMLADGGPSWKRFRPAAFGRAVPILKRTSHITVEIDRPVKRNGTPPPSQPKAKSVAKPAPAGKTSGRTTRTPRTARASSSKKPAPKTRRASPSTT